MRWTLPLALAGTLVAGATTVIGSPTVAAPAATPPPAPCAAFAAKPWCDTALSADQRAAKLLAVLTTNEKISLLAGDEYLGALGREGTHTGTSNGVPRVGIPTVYFSDGPNGPRQGKSTQMPSPMVIASSFDVDAAHLDGATIADEAVKKGNSFVYAPGVNIGRTPLNGRTFEYLGEDPYLSGKLGAAFIRGVQSQGVVANVKHFAVNNQEGQGSFSIPGIPVAFAGQGNRFFVDARVDERTLREIYLPAFEAAVKEGGVGTVMCSYNKVNGTYACENEHLLTAVLRDDWGFDGFVLTDYGAGHNTLRGLRNGLDLDIWPGLTYNPLAVSLALGLGNVDIGVIDLHVRRILRTMFEFGIFDRPLPVDDGSRIDAPAHAEVAADLGADGMVLLKNAGDLLPLPASTGTVAVIGPEADLIKNGGGSSAVEPLSLVTPLAGLRARLGTANVLYDDGKDAAKAAATAARADVAVVVVGDKMTEGSDKKAPTLNSGQTDGIDRDALITAVAAAQPRTVVALQSGGPVLTPWRQQVPALLEMWYPGQNGGTALARVLFGDAEPAGRLPMTFPASAAELVGAADPQAYPGVNGKAVYSEGVLVGYRGYDAKGLAPAYPFGFGLGYGTVAYDDLTVAPGTGGPAGTVARVSARLTNTSSRATAAAPQLYVGMPSPEGQVQAPRQLKGFDKVPLAPGESRVVTFDLDERAFSYWSTTADDWKVAPGCYRIEVGRSSRDLPLSAIVARGGASCAGAALTVS